MFDGLNIFVLQQQILTQELKGGRDAVLVQDLDGSGANTGNLQKEHNNSVRPQRLHKILNFSQQSYLIQITRYGGANKLSQGINIDSRFVRMESVSLFSKKEKKYTK